MTSLFEEVKSSFEATRSSAASGEGITFISIDEESALGFAEMREYYTDEMSVVTRRGYRHWAGATLPRKTEELMALTSDPMLAGTLSMLFRAFADGVRIGHQNEHLVKMLTHFNMFGILFPNEDFRMVSNQMAVGFTTDEEIFEYLTEFVKSGSMYISHSAGIAHQEIEPHKIWDLWMLVGTACFSATYLAGYRLGCTWRERDVLDGIEIATDKGVSRGSLGEDEGSD